MSEPKKKRNRKLPAPKPEFNEEDRVLRLAVEVPYFGKAEHGEKLEVAIRNELNLQFGNNVKTTLIDTPPIGEAKKKPVKAVAVQKKAAKKK